MHVRLKTSKAETADVSKVNLSEHLIFRHTSTIQLAKKNPDRKTGKYLSISETCQIVGIHSKTYIRKEGRVFPRARRLENGFRIFEYEEAKGLKEIWKRRDSRPGKLHP